MSDYDPEVEAAFSGQPSAPAATQYAPEVEAAYAGTDGSGYNRKSDPVGDLVRQKVSAMPASILGGFRSIYDITAGGKTVAETDKRYQQFVKEHSFQPTDPKAQELSKIYDQASASRANPMTWPGRAADVVAENATAPLPGIPGSGAPPEVAPIFSGLLQFGAGVAGLKGSKSPGASSVNSPQSISAAAATPKLTTASPELQQAATEAQQAASASQGKLKADQSVLARHADAESLPVPVRLTKGQATQDPATISHEMNNRGRIPGMPERFNEQNTALVDNVQAIRDRVGPDVFSTNQPAHGDTLIAAYKAKDAAAQADIGQKYQALRDANGGDFPVDAGQILDNAQAALKKELISSHAPAGEMSELQRMAKEGMSYEDFEAMRTNLADVQRSSSSGLERRAAGVIRQQMENLPLQGGAATLKPLADAARAAAKARFEAMDADPAYKAAVNDSVKPDDFTQRFVIGGGRDNVALMKQNLAHDPVAQQTMGVAVLDHLRDSGIRSGNFTQSGYNNALRGVDPKLRSLVDPKTAEDLSTLGQVAHNVQSQPKGSWVNNSNTTVASVADHATGAATGLVKLGVKAKFPILGDIGIKTLENRAVRKAGEAAAKEHLAPGAGILQPVLAP